MGAAPSRCPALGLVALPLPPEHAFAGPSGGPSATHVAQPPGPPPSGQEQPCWLLFLAGPRALAGLCRPRQHSPGTQTRAAGRQAQLREPARRCTALTGCREARPHGDSLGLGRCSGQREHLPEGQCQRLTHGGRQMGASDEPVRSSLWRLG